MPCRRDAIGAWRYLSGLARTVLPGRLPPRPAMPARAWRYLSGLARTVLPGRLPPRPAMPARADSARAGSACPDPARADPARAAAQCPDAVAGDYRVDLSLTVSVPCLLGLCRVAGHDLSCRSACCGHDCHRGQRAAGDGSPGGA